MSLELLESLSLPGDPAKADEMDRAAEYGLALANRIRERTQYHHYEMAPQVWGMELVAALLEDGWTPPEGAF